MVVVGTVGGHHEILRRETPTSSICGGIAMAQAGRDDQGPVLAAACRWSRYVERCFPCCIELYNTILVSAKGPP